MALTFIRRADPDHPEQELARRPYIADRRWYLTADGTPVLEGDPRAHTLLIAKGHSIPGPRARDLGLAQIAAEHDKHRGRSYEDLQEALVVAQERHEAYEAQMAAAVAQNLAANAHRIVPELPEGDP